jgi:uncharacterized protein YndB with AHSA1/START domain
VVEIRIVRDYPHPPSVVWRAVTDPALVPRWTSTGRGGRPEGFSAEVGSHFRFVAKPIAGWRGIVDCEVLAADEPTLLRYSWVGDEGARPTFVSYRIEETADGSRFTYAHTGFRGIPGLVMAKLVLGPVRRTMLDVGLPAVLDDIDHQRLT